MSDLLNSLPSVIEDIIYDYKLDLDIVSETKKKFNYVMLEFNDVIIETDIIHSAYMEEHPTDYISFSVGLLITIEDSN